MAEPARPTAALTRGRSNWYFATTLENYRAPTVTELTAASTLDFTLMAFRNGTTMPDAEVNRVVAEARLGDDKEFERRGMTKHTGGTLIYALNPQAAAGSIDKKAWETWVDGGSGFLVQRYNVPRATGPGLGQFVTVHPVDVSDSIVVPVGDGEAGEVGGKAQYFITDEPAKLVALVA